MSDKPEQDAALEAVRTEDTQALEKILYRSLPEWNRCCKDDEFCPYDGHCSTGQARAVIDAGWRPAATFDLMFQVMGDALRSAKAEAWDEAVAALRYEDGTPVEMVANSNPYRAD